MSSEDRSRLDLDAIRARCAAAFKEAVAICCEGEPDPELLERDWQQSKACAALAGEAPRSDAGFWLKVERVRDQVRSPYFKADLQYVEEALTDALGSGPPASDAGPDDDKAVEYERAWKSGYEAAIREHHLLPLRASDAGLREEIEHIATSLEAGLGDDDAIDDDPGEAVLDERHRLAAVLRAALAAHPAPDPRRRLTAQEEDDIAYKIVEMIIGDFPSDKQIAYAQLAIRCHGAPLVAHLFPAPEGDALGDAVESAWVNAHEDTVEGRYDPNGWEDYLPAAAKAETEAPEVR